MREMAVAARAASRRRAGPARLGNEARGSSVRSDGVMVAWHWDLNWSKAAR